MRKLLLLAAVASPLAACSDSASSGGNVSFGGAQDIGEFRGILDRGEIPAANTLDANGFFNEHYNAPPPATCGKVLCLTPGLASGFDWLTGAKQRTLQISVHTPVDPTTYTRPPLDLVVVVDHSGSMASDGRMDKVKSGLNTLIDGLAPEDRLAIISFDDDVTINSAFASELDRPHLHDVVASLQPDGSTNIYGGLEAGFAQLASHDRTHQRRVIFMSDGLATAGNTSTFDIQAMAETHVRDGIGLTTVGVGDEFDVELMRGLAERGSGNFYFLETLEAATEVFTQELDYFTVPLALDITITANAGSAYSFGEVTGTKLWSGETTNGSLRIPAAFLSSRTSMSGEPGRRGGGSMIFMHLETTEPAAQVADFVMSYRDPATGEIETETVSLEYGTTSPETEDAPYLSAPEMAQRYAMYNMFLGLRLATNSYGGCAAAALRATKTHAQAWLAHHDDADLAADVTLVDQYLANLVASGQVTTGDETTLASCPGAADPYMPTEQYPTGSFGNDDVHYGCASAGKPSGLGLLVLGLAFAIRRRGAGRR